MQYTIMHTEAKYAIDGKDHFKVMVYKEPKGILKDFASTSLCQATGVDHATKEEAERELKVIKKVNRERS